jgi:hypothetical protein
MANWEAPYEKISSATMQNYLSRGYSFYELYKQESNP